MTQQHLTPSSMAHHGYRPDADGVGSGVWSMEVVELGWGMVRRRQGGGGVRKSGRDVWGGLIKGGMDNIRKD